MSDLTIPGIGRIVHYMPASDAADRTALPAIVTGYRADDLSLLALYVLPDARQWHVARLMVGVPPVEDGASHGWSWLPVSP